MLDAKLTHQIAKNGKPISENSYLTAHCPMTTIPVMPIADPQRPHLETSIPFTHAGLIVVELVFEIERISYIFIKNIVFMHIFLLSEYENII